MKASICHDVVCVLEIREKVLFMSGVTLTEIKVGFLLQNVGTNQTRCSASNGYVRMIHYSIEYVKAFSVKKMLLFQIFSFCIA